MDEKTKTAQTSSNASASMLNSKDDKSTKEIPAKDGRSENENIGGEKSGKDASIPPNKGVEEPKETSAASDTAKDTGKSFSEALIFASINPQYDDRLFIEYKFNT